MKTNERGLALLSALLSVALLTLIVVEMTDTTFVHSHLARNAGNAISAQLLARSAETGVEALVVEVGKSKDPMLRKTLLQGLPPVPVGPGSVAFQVRDEGGKLDLNQMGRHRTALEALFDELDLDDSLLDAVAVRVGAIPETEARRSAAADCALPLPCDPPIGPLRSIDDLLTIRGFTPAIVEALRPYVTAGGKRGSGQLAVNAAPSLVLRAVGCSVDQGFPEPPRDYEDLQTFQADAECEATVTLGLNGDLYSIYAVGQVGDATQSIRSTVRVNGGKVERLAWKEQPVLGPAPDTVR
ncbi:MAG: general secretion pathway protein GspK [Deltaproteobacteria bacterium]|nr:general secretion pathway protein GspK [Deltaproteobacteria bacterium]